VLAADSWDGYPTERKELMTFLREESIKNVVVLSGDIHAAFAGTIDDDFDAAADARTTVATELVGPGVTSNSLFSFFEFASRLLTSLRPLVTVDTTAKGGAKFTENFNLLMLHGTNSARKFALDIATTDASVGDAVQAAIGASTQPNPHLKYVDTNAQGFGYLQVTADQVAAQIVTINRPIAAPTDAGPGVKRTASFTIPKDNPAGMTTTITGTKPFPVI
jgi:alkaline phosphatase D